MCVCYPRNMNGEMTWKKMRTIVKSMTKMEIALLEDLIAFRKEEEEE